MISNVHGVFPYRGLGRRYLISLLTTPDHDVDIVGLCEGHNFHIVSPSAASCHSSNMLFKRTLNVTLCRLERVSRSRVASSVFAFGLTSRGSSREYVDELSEEIFILAHVINCAQSEFMVLALTAIQLV